MPLSSDSFIDRLALKAQITKWRALAILFAVLAGIVVTEHFAPGSPMRDDYIARITFDNIIEDNKEIYDLIDGVAEDDKVKAAIIWLDTPGGSAVGGEEIFERLRALSARKPTVAVMRSVSASAGYMVALGTDYIIAREGTITGSIGVILQTAEFTELLDKLGVNPITIKSAPLKASPSPLEKASPEAEKVLKDVIMDFYGRFVDMVAERRGLSRAKAEALADGRVFSGKRALEVKLIDALGGEKEAVAWLVKTHNISADLPVDDVEVVKQKPLLEQILQGATGKFWQNSRLGLDGLVAIWHPSQY
jgi:protease IV